MAAAARRSFVWQALGFYVLALLLSLASSVLLALAGLPFGWVMLLGELIGVGAPAVALAYLTRRVLDTRVFVSPKGRIMPWVVLVGVSATIVAVQKGLATRAALGDPDFHQPIPSDFATLFLVVLAAPITEELLFRAGIQRLFALQWKTSYAVLATAFLFAVFHGTIDRFGETFVIGLFAGVMFVRTGNYWAPVFIHMICNTLGLVFLAHPKPLWFVLNEGSALAFVALAVWGAYMAGPKPAASIRGLMRRLRWALFGATGPERPYGPASRAAVATFWGLATVLFFGTIILYVFGRQAGVMGARGRITREEQEWVIISADDAIVHSRLTPAAWPLTSPTLTIRLPYEEAQLTSATLDGLDVTSRALPGAGYELARPDAATSEPEALTLAWAMPLAAVRLADGRLAVKAQSLRPVRFLRLTVALVPGCGHVFPGQPGKTHMQVLTHGSPQETQDFGRCGLGVTRVGDGGRPL